MLNEIVDLMTETVCTQKASLVIAGDTYPAVIFARLISEKKGESISGKATFNDISSKDWFAKEVGYL